MTTLDQSALSRIRGACRLAGLRLDQAELGALVSRSQFDELVERALAVVEASEVMAAAQQAMLQDRLVDPEARRDFSIALNGLLYGKRSLEQRFDHFVGLLYALDLGTWPLATVWPFLRYPDRFLMVDAGWWPAAADAGPDWSRYRASQRQAHAARQALGAADLVPVYLAGLASPSSRPSPG